MTYDLYVWKRKRGATVTRGLAFLSIAENLPCEGLASLPREKVLEKIRERFGPEPDFELEVVSSHAFFGLPHSQASTLAPWFRALAAELSLEIYDPQEESPSEEDSKAFEEIARATVSDVVADDVRRWLGEAEAGDVVAMNELGTCYAAGEGVQADQAKAVGWYERAANAGFLPALLNLADCHRRGEGVPVDSTAAARLYTQAFERDRCVAAFALGEMYRDGEGVEKSVDRAEEYFLAARSNHHPEAYLALKGIGRAPQD